MRVMLFIGLGNPGPAYEYTRHNLGIRVLRRWVDFMRERGEVVSDWKQDSALRAQVARIDSEYCLFPLTNMNASGFSVSAFLRNKSIEYSDMLIIHDDLELPFGEVKIKESGSANGHNGVRSIHDALGTNEMPRLRIGINRPPEGVEVEKYVLEPFTTEEERMLPEIIKRATVILSERMAPPRWRRSDSSEV